MPSRKSNRWQALVVHTFRVGLVLALLMAIPSPGTTRVEGEFGPPPDDVLVLPDDLVGQGEWKLLAQSDANGMWPIINARGETRALVARTLPEAQDAVGYRGPTEASIVLSKDLRIASVAILSSADTQEHVEAVRRDQSFFQQFADWEWGSPPSVRVDAVSGATLTSLALAEGVLARIGDQRPSLVFPDPPVIDEIQPVIPDAAFIDERTGTITDGDGNTLGRLMRTGPSSDDVIGYQGPTELFVHLSPEQVVVSVWIRGSYDNEPYVGYVRQERGFWAIFREMKLQELANFSPAEAGVEGVSGATMTSMAVADTLVAAAKHDVERQSQEQASRTPFDSVRVTPAEIATVAMLVALVCLSRLKRFRRGWFRRLWLFTALAVVGIWSGNLVSLALVAGWSAEGVAWRLAPGLASITAFALLVPPLTKRNPYCGHLCPHGALQQLVLPSQTPRRLSIPKRLNRWLVPIPGVTLAVAYVALIVVPTLDLSTWEPFHAYLFRVAGVASILFAVGTLLVATRVPMAYCRLGCPTGFLIDYLRRTALSGRVRRSDYVALALLVFAMTWRQFGSPT